MPTPTVIVTDLEGVLTPEIWIAVAEKTGIDRLRLTTRDIPDYDELMRGRIRILNEHNLALHDIQAVIATITPLPGARAYLDWVRAHAPLIILSDTFYEFAGPLMVQLGHPTLFCHSIEVDTQNRITGYRLRQEDSKRQAVLALKGLAFRVIAVGDSYNDTAMLSAADYGVLFRPPANVVAEFPQFPVLHTYDELRALVEGLMKAE
jgi:phosphoserine/homoserine phosphotransferase